MSDSKSAFQARREARAAVAKELERIMSTFANNAAVCAYDAAELQTVVFSHIKNIERYCDKLRGGVRGEK